MAEAKARVATGRRDDARAIKTMVHARRERERRLHPLLSLAARIRGRVRASEIWLLALATGFGAVAGLVVALMSGLTQLLHRFLFALPPGTRLSGAISVAPARALFVLVLGGLVLGLSGLAWRRVRTRPPVDPIEANALHGGRMTMVDSLVVAFQTIISNGFGASVGLEAGYTQMGSAIASKIGSAFRLRRNDMRVLVGCGAAGAIAAAFDAPLTGAFYGFELIIGIYSVAVVAPVMAAAIAADVVVRAVGGAATPIDVYAPGPTAIPTLALFLVLGILAAGIGIAIMCGVTLTENLIRRTRLPDYLRPALGGAVVAGLASISPQVLSAGHGALHVQLDTSLSFWSMLFLFCLKATASAVSLGSGFRGGLFFASLFLGSLLGRLFYAVFLVIDPTTSLDPAIAAVVGMSALAVAIVGGPLTMTFLTLETTRDLTITGIVLTACLVSALTVRQTFGYSFSTWRLHLRGETIRSAQDVGWMRSLTVGRMMRRDLRTILISQSLVELRRKYPLGATPRVVVVDTDGRYQGIIDVAEAHAPERDAEAETIKLADLLHHQVDFLLPPMTVKTAVSLFDETESEALAVVDNNKDRKVLGLLTEAYALKRYAEELDKARRSLAGEN